MRKLLIILTSLCLLVPFNSALAQSKRKKKKQQETAQKAPAEKKSTSKIKPYSQVITSEAVTDEGLFSVHKVGDKYFF